MKKEDKEDKENDDGNDVVKALALFTQLGVTMSATVIFTLIVGYFIDRWLGTSPWLLLISALLGVMAAVRNMYVLIKRQFK